MSRHPHGKVGPDHPSRQPSTDQLTAIAHFFDELEAKTPIKHMQKETDGNKTLLDTINALIAVGAFIAGVQAQLISIAYSSSGDALGKATNWFGFVGLTLDLIGTSAGVVRALLLQKAIQRSHRLAVRLTGQIDGARHEMREQQDRRATDPRSRAFLADSMRGISRIMAIFAEDGRFGVQAAAEGGTTGAQAAATTTTEIDLDALSYHPRLPSRGKGDVHPFREWVWRILPHLNVEGIGQCIAAARRLDLVRFYCREHARLEHCSDQQSSQAQARRSLRPCRRNIKTLSARQAPCVSSPARKQLRHLTLAHCFAVTFTTRPTKVDATPTRVLELLSPKAAVIAVMGH